MCEDYIRKLNATGKNAIYCRLMQDSGLALMLFAWVTKSHTHITARNRKRAVQQKPINFLTSYPPQRAHNTGQNLNAGILVFLIHGTGITSNPKIKKKKILGKFWWQLGAMTQG